uniref:Uncharacterized protein n=1 Tax=Arundo donax TaxID=35708 RepID=A0A0A9BJU3_ARUDO
MDMAFPHLGNLFYLNSGRFCLIELICLPHFLRYWLHLP